MATKKATKKNTSSKKDAPKRTTKKTKAAQTNEAVIVEESKGIYTLATPDVVNPQITDSVTTTLPEVTPTVEAAAITEPADIVEENKQVDNSDIITDNVSYNNMIVPQAKDNTILYIGAGLGLIVLLTIFFL